MTRAGRRGRSRRRRRCRCCRASTPTSSVCRCCWRPSLALQRGRRVLALVCSALTLAASPLAFLFLVGVVTAVLLSGRGAWRASCCRRRRPRGAGRRSRRSRCSWCFPAMGVYPFLVWHLVAVGGLACAGTLLAIATGDTADRAAARAAGAREPGVVPRREPDRRQRGTTSLRRLPAPAAAGRVAGEDGASRRSSPRRHSCTQPRRTSIQVGEQADASSSHARAPGRRPSRVPARPSAAGARVEVVPTSARWEAYYLPTRGIPLARGWFRQTDMARNRLFYRRTLTRAAYGLWLERSAVAVRRADALSARRSRCRQRGPSAAPARLGSARRLEASPASRSSRRLTERGS